MRMEALQKTLDHHAMCTPAGCHPECVHWGVRATLTDAHFVAHLPTDARARKSIPLYSGLLKYFPDALIAVAELSRIGNDQHNPGKPLHWDRTKSQDELDALTRHLIEAGTIDNDNVRHSTKVAWRALANLQKELEAQREKND